MPSCPPSRRRSCRSGRGRTGASASSQVSRELEPLYPRMSDFRALRDRVDPDRVFGNAFLDRVLG